MRRKKINGHCLEYWKRGNALPAQPEVEKQKKKEAQSCKLQAASFKRHKRNTFKWENIKNRKKDMLKKKLKK